MIVSYWNVYFVLCTEYSNIFALCLHVHEFVYYYDVCELVGDGTFMSVFFSVYDLFEPLKMDIFLEDEKIQYVLTKRWELSAYESVCVCVFARINKTPNGI